MHSQTTPLLRLLSLLIIISAAAAAAGPPERARPADTSDDPDFIRLSCRSTLYPDLCYQSLSPYNQTIQTSVKSMALTALTISLNATASASKTVRRISKQNRDKLSKREASAVADCVETVQDAVEELQDSMAAMRDLEGPEFRFKVSNIQTWVSAALTDDNTCMEGIDEDRVSPSSPSTATGRDGEEVKRMIRSEIVNVAVITSVALALLSKLMTA
uniref:Pectinesterase inhibitor domain-containing protein n=1 Tax=Kalanchoe fedtschenkoi TaxID=63787 RepID=A0A7N0TSS5_KALFE